MHQRQISFVHKITQEEVGVLVNYRRVQIHTHNKPDVLFLLQKANRFRGSPIIHKLNQIV